MTGQAKRMQSPCEGLTMLILIFIMMNTNDDNARLTITQMMIMRGQAKRMQSPLPKSHTAIGLPTGTARPHCTIGVVMMI